MWGWVESMKGHLDVGWQTKMSTTSSGLVRPVQQENQLPCKGELSTLPELTHLIREVRIRSPFTTGLVHCFSPYICLVHFCVAVTWCLTRSNSREERFVLAFSYWENSPSWWDAIMRGGGVLVTLPLQSRCTDQWMPVVSSPFLIQSRTSGFGMVLPTVRMGLPTCTIPGPLALNTEKKCQFFCPQEQASPLLFFCLVKSSEKTEWNKNFTLNYPQWQT